MSAYRSFFGTRQPPVTGGQSATSLSPNSPAAMAARPAWQPGGETVMGNNTPVPNYAGQGGGVMSGLRVGANGLEAAGAGLPGHGPDNTPVMLRGGRTGGGNVAPPPIATTRGVQLGLNRQAQLAGQERLAGQLNTLKNGGTLDDQQMLGLLQRGPQGYGDQLSPEVMQAFRTNAQSQLQAAQQRRDADLARAGALYGENFTGTAPDWQGFYNRQYEDTARYLNPWLQGQT